VKLFHMVVLGFCLVSFCSAGDLWVGDWKCVVDHSVVPEATPGRAIQDYELGAVIQVERDSVDGEYWGFLRVPSVHQDNDGIWSYGSRRWVVTTNATCDYTPSGVWEFSGAVFTYHRQEAATGDTRWVSGYVACTWEVVVPSSCKNEQVKGTLRNLMEGQDVHSDTMLMCNIPVADGGLEVWEKLPPECWDRDLDRAFRTGKH
jgi:hypothetical protein